MHIYIIYDIYIYIYKFIYSDYIYIYIISFIFPEFHGLYIILDENHFGYGERK